MLERFTSIFKSKEREIEYASKVTRNYFESGWSDLAIEGVGGLKEKIRDNIVRIEWRNAQAYRELASILGVTIEEYKERLQQKAEQMVANSNFFRATSMAVLNKIMLVDGRWKSQFETGTSEGTLNPTYRSLAEKTMFGTTHIVMWKKAQRPIYGYFSDGENGEINNEGTIPPPSILVRYGAVNVKIKKEVAMKRATLTFQDSLDNTKYMTPTPASKPHFSSFKLLGYYGTHTSDPVTDNVQSTKKTNWGGNYTEAQYHGGLTMEDVESIHISKQNCMTEGDMETVRISFAKYKELHPDSQIKLIEY